MSQNSEHLALPVGLALGVIFNESLKGKLDKAAGRLEQLTGNPDIQPHIALRWNAAAVDLISHGFFQDKERYSWLEKSDDILKATGAETFAYSSNVSTIPGCSFFTSMDS